MTKRRNTNAAATASKSPDLRRAACEEIASKNGAGAGKFFSQMASRTSQLAGKPLTFLIAVGVVLVWAACGPFFGFSDTWQLVINTSTTIVTFLMVFLIQNTQNRDTMALQLKLSELIIAVHGAENDIATVEDLSEEELEQLHETYRKRADETLGHLERRRGSQLKKAG
jgi:low affinity Fe/Cu permease